VGVLALLTEAVPARAAVRKEAAPAPQDGLEPEPAADPQEVRF
jgi:hypothetical protein